MKWGLKSVCAILICRSAQGSEKIDSVFPMAFTTSSYTQNNVTQALGGMWYRSEKMLTAENRGSMRMHPEKAQRRSDVVIETRSFSYWQVWNMHDGQNIYLIFGIQIPSAIDNFLYMSSTRRGKRIVLVDGKKPKALTRPGPNVRRDDSRLFLLEQAMALSDEGYVLKHVKTSLYVTAEQTLTGSNDLRLTSFKFSGIVWSIRDRKKT